jgi:hypothetical protein
VSPAPITVRSRSDNRAAMRTMFTAYTLLIAAGIVIYIVVGIAHH